MTKKDKGFTLVEILGVVILLGLVALIIIPFYDKYVNEARNDSYQIQVDNICLSAKAWAGDNLLLLPQEEGEKKEITLGELMDSGYVELDIVNPKTKKRFSRDSIIEIKKVEKIYKYNFIEG